MEFNNSFLNEMNQLNEMSDLEKVQSTPFLITENVLDQETLQAHLDKVFDYINSNELALTKAISVDHTNNTLYKKLKNHVIDTIDVLDCDNTDIDTTVADVV